MKHLFTFYLILFFSVTLTGCEVIGDIFKAGMWVGVIGVLLIAGLIIYIISKLKG